MGCGTSTPKENEENEGSKFDFSRRNTIVEKPNVAVEIGKGVKKIDPERRIVFIFGRWNCFFCVQTILCFSFIVHFTLPEKNNPSTAAICKSQRNTFDIERRGLCFDHYDLEMSLFWAHQLVFLCGIDEEVLLEGNFDSDVQSGLLNQAQIRAGFCFIYISTWTSLVYRPVRWSSESDSIIIIYVENFKLLVSMPLSQFCHCLNDSRRFEEELEKDW